MGEHHIKRKYGPKDAYKQPVSRGVTMLHVSKELHVVPRMQLGTDGKTPQHNGEYDFVLHRGDGSTYRRKQPKQRKQKGNDWGAEPYKAYRDRSQLAHWARLAAMSLDLK
jgi:hypothetical protein